MGEILLLNWKSRAVEILVAFGTILFLGVTVLSVGAQNSSINISKIHYDAEGNDWNHPNDEYVVVSNETAETIDMSGLTLSDEADHVFSFPDGFGLPKDESVTVYSGSGTNTESELYWRDGAIWNNAGDIASLKDSAGNVVDRVEYPGGGTEWVKSDEEARDSPSSLPEKVTVKITEVVDGDTVDIRLPSGAENTVRVLGVDTPEIYHRNEAGEYDNIDNLSFLREWGYKAKSYVENLIENDSATLVFDSLAGRTGYYGRWLGYIIFDNKNLSRLLVKEGYARAYNEGNCRLEDSFVKSQKVATSDYAGLWGILQPKKTENPLERRIRTEAEGTVLQYRENLLWGKESFSEIVRNKNEFESSWIENFKHKFEYGKDFKVKLEKSANSTILSCDIHNVISKSDNEYTARFSWLIRPLGLDLLENDFKEHKWGLSWKEKISGVDTSIVMRFPSRDTIYGEWHHPNGHCHAHVWWKAEKLEGGAPWALIGGVIAVVIAISLFILYRRK